MGPPTDTTSDADAKDAGPHTARRVEREGKMGDPRIDSLHDVYEEQLGAARYKAERDQARQELAKLKDRSRDTTVSAYDLLPKADHEALRWVRGHGGLDEVRRDFQDAYNRRTELCAALGIDLDTGWSDAMAELDRRLMPEGYEWPTVDGKPVDFVTGYEPSIGVLEAVSIYSNGACEVMGHDGIIKDVKEIHVVTPKVLDADGDTWERIEADAATFVGHVTCRDMRRKRCAR